ncbi:MAG: tetratricopeptide repeat protein [Verrucomicrobia bacterium]|nr:tetratricopeptide repeat protein [Verrucomicrobiota bacterium]
MLTQKPATSKASLKATEKAKTLLPSLPSVRNSLRRATHLSVLVLAASLEAIAAEKSPARPEPPPRSGAAAKAVETIEKSVEAIVEAVRPSVVVVSHAGRDGKEDSVGSGFVVSADGLIATCLHVIGEARPITVRLANGARHDVIEIHAWDRKLDLALIRVEAKDLPALPLGDSETLKQGAAVVAIGNPLGLEYSVVQGVVSARRDFDGIDMIQLAIPIEEGNSGGPLLDRQGRVHGILTLKSAMSANLGFATPVDALKLLLAKPNPVPMTRWLTLSALNPKEWTPVMGARWSRKAGRIEVDGLGNGFGGRALCLSQKPAPKPPYELAVTVKLDNETGAAGLVFASDGDQRHYGFYPSGGNLRLTRFDGPSVFAWTILKEAPSPHYRPGDWNRLRVRVEDDALRCYVNEQLVFESSDREWRGGKVGLAKFRDTRAAFKDFQMGTNLAAAYPAAPADFLSEITAKLNSATAAWNPEIVARLQSHPEASRLLLAERARQLDKQAAEVRELAWAVHRGSIERRLIQLLEQAEEQTDLFEAALLLAKLDNPDLDLAAYQQQLADMAAELKAQLPPQSDDAAKIEALKKYLFFENGFHGSRTGDYYNRANSYMNHVLDDREGIPISLSVLFIELARRIGLERVAGVGLPGHFVVKHAPKHGEEQIIDVFEGGKPLTPSEVREIVTITGRQFTQDYLRAATKREIIIRMLRNLAGIARNSESPRSALGYLDLILALDPSATSERLERAMARMRAGDRTGAKEDLQWLLEKEPPAINLERVRELYRSL